MKINIADVGKRIRAVRKKRHLTLEQLAGIINRDKQTVWRWEKSERGVALKTLKLLAEKLDCHPSYLLGYNDDIDAPYEDTSDRADERATPRTFGYKLREARKKVNASIEDFANMAALPISRITELENAIHAPDSRELKNISDILGLRPEELLEDAGAWECANPPGREVIELARKMLEIYPFLNAYLDGIRPTDAEARFLAAAVRLAFEKRTK